MSAVKLFHGDARCETLFQVMKDVMYERGKGLPIPSVIGVLELLKQDILAGEE